MLVTRIGSGALLLTAALGLSACGGGGEQPQSAKKPAQCRR